MFSANEIVDYVIATLDDISISGANNMRKLLGCIEALKEMKRVLEKGEEAKAPEEEGGDE